ncbi:hypothetical protein R6Q59_015438 [Mikania micrantha]
MENSNQSSFWQFSDQLRVQSNNLSNLSLNDSIWSTPYASRRPEKDRRNFDIRVGGGLINFRCRFEQNGFKKDEKFVKNGDDHLSFGGKHGKNKKKNNNNNNTMKRIMTLPASESLPRNETVGGYIFVCNNDTMQENLKRQLFGLPPRYRDSVRQITPGLPLFLYNYSTHQLHGVFEAASFGGTNIDPSAWEDKKNPGESRFPAQVRVMTRKLAEPLEEDSFRPILHHYDGPKFRLELNIPEALSLLDIFEDNKN